MDRRTVTPLPQDIVADPEVLAKELYKLHDQIAPLIEDADLRARYSIVTGIALATLTTAKKKSTA